MNKIFVLSACALATSALLSEAVAQEAALESVVVTAKRSARISTGATGLSLDVKETPQSISILDAETMTNFGTTGSTRPCDWPPASTSSNTRPTARSSTRAALTSRARRSTAWA